MRNQRLTTGIQILTAGSKNRRLYKARPLELAHFIERTDEICIQTYHGPRYIIEETDEGKVCGHELDESALSEQRVFLYAGDRQYLFKDRLQKLYKLSHCILRSEGYN